MLDKVKIGALVSAIVVVLGAFGITIPPDISTQLVVVATGIVSIVSYVITAWVKKERQANVDKLDTV